MPQEIRVLQCFSCKIFQVDIVKKSSKWQCRVCNNKQTLRKEYFRGTAAECRIMVQELNMKKGQKHNESVNSMLEELDAVADNICSFENEDFLEVARHNGSNDHYHKVLKEEIPHKSNCDFNMMFNFSQSKKYSRATETDYCAKVQEQRHSSSLKRIKDDHDLFHTINNFDNKEEDNKSKKDFPFSSSNEINTMFDFSQTNKWNYRPKTSHNAKKSKWDKYV